jgi:predicted RecA/RadA family phage recombinase
MAKNYIGQGRRFICTAPSGGVVSGRLYVIGAMFGIALTTAAQGATFQLAIGEAWTLPKASGAITQGAVVYWDSTAGNVTTTVGSNTKIGVAESAAASGDATVQVKLNDNF